MILVYWRNNKEDKEKMPLVVEDSSDRNLRLKCEIIGTNWTLDLMVTQRHLRTEMLSPSSFIHKWIYHRLYRPR